MLSAVFEAYESNSRYYSKRWPATFHRASGSYLYAEDGTSYIDFFCGAGALNFGHNNPQMKQSLIEYLLGDSLLHGLDMLTTARSKFVESFAEKVLIPKNLDYKMMITAPTGTNAVEAACKIARKHTGRKSIWHFMGSFHGMTLGSLSLSSNLDYRHEDYNPLFCSHAIPSPFLFPELDVIEYLHTILENSYSGVSKPAAIIIETTQAEGGVNVFSDNFLRGLRCICSMYGIILIVDDIQVGCWRTGTFFSFERARITPDIVCMSKSLSGIGQPFALVLVRRSLDCLDPGEHSGTFRGNQLAMVAANACIEYTSSNEFLESLSNRCQRIEKLVRVTADSFGLKHRGVGFIWGIDLEGVDDTDRFVTELFERGVLAETCGANGQTLKIMPAINAPDNALETGFELLNDALNSHFDR